MLDQNPLLKPYVLPPFSAIRVEHVVPAIEHIIADSRIKVARIITSQTPYPTWDDLVLAMDEVRARIDETVHVIDILSSVRTEQGWADATKRCSALVMDYNAQLAQNRELFELYQALAESPIAALFDESRKNVLQAFLLEYRLSGIQLTQGQQLRLRELDTEINQLENTFISRVQHANNAWSQHIEDESMLAGIPEDAKRGMANKAQEKNLSGWVLTLSPEQFREVMLYAQNRTLRKDVWTAFHSRASAQGLPDDSLSNERVLAALLKCRHEKANLLGYDNFAQLALEGQMAESTDQVLALIRNTLNEQQSAFAHDSQQLQALAAHHAISHVQPWDYEYLAEKISQQHGASQEELRQYFPLDTVLNRLYHFAHRMFGVELVECSAFDSWHKDVRLIEVKEHNQTLGYLYIDPYRREVGGGWGDTLGLRNRRVTAEGRSQLPIAVLRSQLTPGSEGKPCLLDHQQLRIVFHEFGHCLQQLLTQQKVGAMSGINALGHDSVEFLSQVLEQWCFSSAFLTWLSSHYQTHQPAPAERVEQMIKGVRTQTSWATANLLLMILFDVEIHRTYGDGRSAQDVFDALNTEIGLLQWPHPARPYNSGEFIASSYGARVYSYKWSGVLASRAFEQFEKKGVFDPVTGRAFREAFFPDSAARSLKESLEVFLGVSPSHGG